MNTITSYLTTLPSHQSQLLAAFAAYHTLFLLISPRLSTLLLPKHYPSLPPRTKINWNLRVVSQVQSIFICIVAFQVLFNDPVRVDADRDARLWAYSPAAGRVQAFAGGYFLWDIMVSVLYMDAFGPSALIHAVCAFGITMLGFRPFANYYGINFVLYELSTPFLNVHWALDKLDMTGSTLQLINGVCLITTFAGCRLVWGSYQTYLLTRDILSAWGKDYSYTHCKDGDECAGPQVFPVYLVMIYLVSNTMLTTLNFFWFGKMIEALRKRLLPKPEGKVNGNSTQKLNGKKKD